MATKDHKQLTPYKPGHSGNPKGMVKGMPKGRSLTAWLNRIFDERVKFRSGEGEEYEMARGEAFARWLARTPQNTNEDASVRNTAMKIIMDRVAPIEEGGIALPDIKIVIVANAPKRAEFVDVKAVKALPRNGNGRNGKLSD